MRFLTADTTQVRLTSRIDQLTLPLAPDEITEDNRFQTIMKRRLAEALTGANVDHTIETYPAKHGWVLRDTPVYDHASAERHWKTLLALFDGTL